jgi:hypothetical protein
MLYGQFTTSGILSLCVSNPLANTILYSSNPVGPPQLVLSNLPPPKPRLPSALSSFVQAAALPSAINSGAICPPDIFLPSSSFQHLTHVIQDVQKVSLHLMITTQKFTNNVQSVPRQSSDTQTILTAWQPTARMRGTPDSH